MKGIRVVGVTFALAISALLSASASASEYEVKGLPELGRCVRVAKGTGEFKGANCVTVAGGTGTFDWHEGPGASKKFSGTATATSLETVGKKQVTCTGASFKGEYLTPKVETVTATLVGCTEPASGKHCQSSPVKDGEVETESLEGELGFIRSGKSPIVGWDLQPTRPPATSLMTFECGKLPEATIIHEVVEGSVIASVSRTNLMVKGFKLVYTVKAGKQNPEHFESRPKDTLSTTFGSGLEAKTVETTVLRTTVLTTDEEPLEIKKK